MKLHAQIHNNKLLPEYNSDHDKLKQIRPGVTYSVEIKQPRNLQFHRKFFSLLNLVYDNQEHFNNLDEMRAWLTMKAGFYKRVSTPTGEMYQPKSISFASMDDLQFNEFYNSVLDVVCEWLHISDEDVQEQLVNYF